MKPSYLRAAAIFSGCLGAAALFLAGRAEGMPLCAAATCATLVASDVLEGKLFEGEGDE